MKKTMTALACALALLISSSGCATSNAAESAPSAVVETDPVVTVEDLYTDVVSEDWYADAVAEVTRRGLMSGVETGIFAPWAQVNRATVVIVLWRLEGCPELDPAIAENEGFAPFPDTEPWFADAANWAKSAGIASGYAGSDPAHPAGAFGGRDLVTREQLAQFFYNYALYKGTPIAEGMLAPFNDAHQVSAWAETAVRHAVGMGILQGDNFNRLDPQGAAIRAALALMLQRLLTPAAG